MTSVILESQGTRTRRRASTRPDTMFSQLAQHGRVCVCYINTCHSLCVSCSYNTNKGDITIASLCIGLDFKNRRWPQHQWSIHIHYESVMLCGVIFRVLTLLLTTDPILTLTEAIKEKGADFCTRPCLKKSLQMSDLIRSTDLSIYNSSPSTSRPKMPIKR